MAGSSAAPGAEPDHNSPSDVTVVLHFRNSCAPRTVQEMELEASRILDSSGFRLGWAIFGEHPHDSYPNVVVMTFRGDCRVGLAPADDPGPGPYAITHMTDGDILPFGEVECDRVAYAVRTAIAPGAYSIADELMGRALGRVVAHEMIHMLTRSARHGNEGVGSSALTGKQLIEESLGLSGYDIGRLEESRNAH